MRRLIDEGWLILLSLFLALVVWIVALQEENPIKQDEFPPSIPVQVLNQPEGTTFFPRFEASVKVTIRAPRSSWDKLSADRFTASIDLAGQTTGDHEVNVKVACADKNVRIVAFSPETVSISLRKEISRQVPVQIRYLGSVALGYEMKIDQTTIEPDMVLVTGPEPIVEQVARVTGDLYLSADIKETIERKLTVIARQASGDSVTFVTIEPSAVSVKIPVEQQTGLKEVAVRPVVVGVPAPGYRLYGVSVEPATVTLGGDPAVVKKITGYVDSVPLDVSGATGDVVERLALKLPEGTSIVGIQGVLVTANIEPLPGLLSISRKPIVRGLSTDLVAQVSPETVSLTLTGPLPRLNTLTQEDVQVYVDLVGKGLGEHVVTLTYLVPEGVQVQLLVPTSVDVTISPVVLTPTPTWTPAPTPTPTPTVAGALTETAGITSTVDVALTLTPTNTTVPNARQTPLPTEIPVPTPAITPTATSTKEK